MRRLDAPGSRQARPPGRRLDDRGLDRLDHRGGGSTTGGLDRLDHRGARPPGGGSSFGRTRTGPGLAYLDRVSRAWLFLSRYGLDLLIVVAAIAGALSTAARVDPGRPTGVLLWLEALTVAGLILALLGRRPVPVRGAGHHLARRGGAVVRGRTADRRQRRHVPRRDGSGAAAGQPARGAEGAPRPGDRARVRGDRRLQRTRTGTRSAGLHPAGVRARPGSSGSPCGSAPPRARRPRSARCGPSGNASRRRGSRWPRSAGGSRGSCTTSSPTR